MTIAESLRRRGGYFLVAGGVLALDQLTKMLAHAHLRGREPLVVIPGFFNFWYSRNRGGLFGYFSAWPDPWRAILLTAFPLMAVLAIAVFLARTAETDRRTLAGLAMILGGASGNLVDRLARGEVVDFLDAYVSHAGLAAWLVERFGTSHWPTFNVADSAIVTGAGLLLLDVFRKESKPHTPRGTDESSDAARSDGSS